MLKLVIVVYVVLLIIQCIDCYHKNNNVVRNSNHRLVNRTIRKTNNINTIYMSNSNDVKSMKWELSLRSPCKINLFLRILARRPTGYHDLASLFQVISLSDYMYFSKLPSNADKDQLICSDSSLLVDQSNLVIKALNLMREKTKIKQFFKVYLDKIVPVQAGLGGGSGNAATAMHAFNVLCGYPGNLEDMKLWSGDIGSDITFFFSSGTAYCTGRGEIVTPLKPLPEWESTKVHVFKPEEGLSTALVFKTLDLNALSNVIPESLLDCFESNGAIKSAADGRLVNDLEPPAFKCQPKLLSLKSAIEGLGSSIKGYCCNQHYYFRHYHYY